MIRSPSQGKHLPPKSGARCARIAAALVALGPIACGSSSSIPGAEEDAGTGEPDAGTIGDGGTPTDSGTAATPDAGSSGDAGTATDAGPAPIIAARPYHFHVPAGYAGQTTPLLIMLHGYSASGPEEESYLQLSALSDSEGFLYAYPDGLVDPSGYRFWNATDACCNFYGSTTDDVAYISAIIDDVEAHYPVDTKRIYIYGHSNGGFMANRLGCDLSARIAAFVSMAGDTWLDHSHCQPQSPVAMIQFQGTADQTVSYSGGDLTSSAGAYPGAAQTAADWAALDGCTGMMQDAGVDTSIVTGLTTTLARYSGCASSEVELWSVQGGPHIPALQSAWSAPFWRFLAAHQKP